MLLISSSCDKLYLTGQSYSTQYSSTPDYEAGALKSFLGTGDTTSVATTFRFSCPPKFLLAGITSSKCTIPSVVTGPKIANLPAAVICNFQFTCTPKVAAVIAASTYSAPVGTAPSADSAPVNYNEMSCNLGRFVTTITATYSNLVYSNDGKVSFLGESGDTLILKNFRFARHRHISCDIIAMLRFLPNAACMVTTGKS